VEIGGQRKRIHRYGTLPDQVFDLVQDPLERNDLAAGLLDDANLTADAQAVLDEATAAAARSRDWVRVTTLMSQATSGIRRAIAEARVTALPASAQRLTGRFGDVVRVLGSRGPSAPVRRNGFAEFTVYYQVIAPIPSTMRLMQFGRGSGPSRSHYTHTPVNGLYPAALWQPGEIIADTFSLRVPPQHPDDFIDVSVAFRSADGEEQLPVTEGAGPHDGEVFVGRFSVGP
jgi:hypothetical protein